MTLPLLMASVKALVANLAAVTALFTFLMGTLIYGCVGAPLLYLGPRFGIAKSPDVYYWVSAVT